MAHLLLVVPNDMDTLNAIAIAACWIIAGLLPTLLIHPTTQDKE